MTQPHVELSVRLVHSHTEPLTVFTRQERKCLYKPAQDWLKANEIHGVSGEILSQILTHDIILGKSLFHHARFPIHKTELILTYPPTAL